MVGYDLLLMLDELILAIAVKPEHRAGTISISSFLLSLRFVVSDCGRRILLNLITIRYCLTIQASHSS